MRAFIAYRHTGGDEHAIRGQLTAVRDAFAKRQVDAFCTFFDVRGGDMSESSLKQHNFMEEAFRMIDRSDFLFVLQSDTGRSEGMLMEVGYVIAKEIPLIVATKTNVSDTYLPDMATHSLKWGNLEELASAIATLELAELAVKV